MKKVGVGGFIYEYILYSVCCHRFIFGILDA